MSERPRFRLAADYECHALWELRADGSLENLALENLEISEDLKSGLARWAVVYDATLNQEDPVSSGFATDLEGELFALWGRALARLLVQALQEPIQYFDDYQQTNVIIE